MTITFSTLKSAIKRHLSVIGKRLYTKEGRNMFSDITVSTAEDPIFEQYISAAAQNVESLLRELVTSFSVASSQVSLTLANTRESSDFDARCQELVTTYLTLFTVGEYLAMVHPELAEKYRQDSVQSIQSLLAYAFYKKPPTSPSYSYVNVTGTTEQNE